MTMFRVTNEDGTTVRTINDNEILPFLKRVKDRNAFELIDSYNRKPEKFRATYIRVPLKVKGFYVTNEPDKEKEKREFENFMKRIMGKFGI